MSTATPTITCVVRDGHAWPEAALASAVFDSVDPGATDFRVS
jgi:hypothetical protein